MCATLFDSELKADSCYALLLTRATCRGCVVCIRNSLMTFWTYIAHVNCILTSLQT